MIPDARVAYAAVALCAALISVNCAPKVTSLDHVTTQSTWLPSPFPSSVLVERIRGPQDEVVKPDAHWDGGLAKTLRDQQVFATVHHPRDGTERSDLIIRGNIEPRWDARGASNFFTWWPGGLILAPNWYGTRMSFFAQATIDLVNARTGDIVGKYHASTAHQVVHRSASPGPFFGALIIVPGVVRGSTLTWPRARYKHEIYPVAYAELWQRITSQMIADLSPAYAAEAEARRQKCGEQYNRPPRIGQSWAEFRSCQSAHFEPHAEALLEEGLASVFVNTQDKSRIFVTDGSIVRWERTTSLPTVGAPPGLRLR